MDERLITLNTLHRLLPEAPPLGNFFRTSAYRTALKHLLAEGYAEGDVVRRAKPHPGQAAEAKVHPLIAVEFLRWADYARYSERVQRLLG